MATLREMRDELVSMDDPAKVLRLADMYLTDMEIKGSDFHLPHNHITTFSSSRCKSCIANWMFD